MKRHQSIKSALAGLDATGFALLVKPAVARSSQGSALVSELCRRGAYVVQAHTADDIANELRARGPTVHSLVAVGGDGTVHLALNSVMGTSLALGVIPMGTGNDLARAIGIKSVTDGLHALCTGKPSTVDVGEISHSNSKKRYFIGIASCGFDAQVNSRANTYRGPSGTVKYLVAVFRELAALKPHQLSVTLDSVERTERFTLIAIGNTNSYGGGMFMCPGASLCDGIFSLTLVKEANRRTLVKVLPTVFFGKHINHRLVETNEAKTVSISPLDMHQELLTYADGEFVGKGTANFQILPSAIDLWQAN